MHKLYAINTPRASNSAQSTDGEQKHAAGATVRSLITAAPAAFQRHGYSFERLSNSWGVTRTQAVQFVVAGLVEQIYGPPAVPGRPQLERKGMAVAGRAMPLAGFIDVMPAAQTVRSWRGEAA